MFRLDNILERWAELYRPLRHDAAAHKTFFRISMIDAQSYFIRNYNVQPSPCMAYATHIDAEMAQQNPKAITYRHVIYFLCKQPMSPTKMPPPKPASRPTTWCKTSSLSSGQ